MSLNRLRLVTIAAPLATVIAIEILSVVALRDLVPDTVQRLVLMSGLLLIGATVFSSWVFSVIERQQQDVKRAAELLEQRILELHDANVQIDERRRQLEAANRATTAISADLDPASVLQHIVDAARDLIDARYAALGVSDDHGRIVQFITSGINSQERAAIGPLPIGRGLLGALIHHAEPIRLPRIQDDPRSSGFPLNHPPMTSLLGVPITLGREVVGDLYLTDKTGQEEFSEEDQELLLLLANHAAVAITNARLYAEARRSRDELRTLNADLEAEVAERSRKISQQSREMTRRVFQAQEEERKRIARELHDETAQSLSTLLINIDLLEMQVQQQAAPIRESLDRLRALAKRTLDETRALSHDLRPTILDDVGLVAAIQWFADECLKSYGLQVRVRIDGATAYRLPPDTELALFRITQEALTNAAKYSTADAVEVSLDFPDGSAHLVVTDNGAGFNLDEARGPSRAGGLGLYGMRERAELIGGSLEIRTAPNKGTTVIVVAPVDGHGRPSRVAGDEQHEGD